MSSDLQRPAPNLHHPLYEAYFQGLTARQLRVQGCLHCGHRQWPPRELCTQCCQAEFDWPQVADRGHVYTFSVVHRAPHPWFREHLPYAIVVAELECGLRMIGNSFGDDVAKIACGVAVVAHYQHDDGCGSASGPRPTLLQWVPQG